MWPDLVTEIMWPEQPMKTGTFEQAAFLLMTCGRCYNTYQSKTHATSHSLPGIEHNTTMKDNTKGVKSMSPYGDISTITSVMG